MVSRRRTTQNQTSTPSPRRKPATTLEGRENQLIALAVDSVERRIREGTASAQELVHYIKLGSSREQLEQERLRHENELLQVKREAMASTQRIEELYTNAIAAMRSYQGQPDVEYDDDPDLQ